MTRLSKPVELAQAAAKMNPTAMPPATVAARSRQRPEAQPSHVASGGDHRGGPMVAAWLVTEPVICSTLLANGAGHIFNPVSLGPTVSRRGLHS